MSPLEREEYITNKIYEHYEEACSLGYRVFGVFLQGSQNYGLDIYNDEYQSDVDSKAIVLPSFSDFCSCRKPISTTHERSNKEHIDLKDIRVMFETFKKQNVNFVEILFTDYYVVSPRFFNFYTRLRSIAEDLTHCNPSQTLRTMAGLSFEKRKALCHPYPSIIDKINQYGYDGKQLHHIIRINDFMKKYISGAPFSKCLTERDSALQEQLERAKLNKYSLAEAIEIADRLNDENKAIKDTFIAEHGSDCNTIPYRELEQIKVDILQTHFRQELSL